MKKELEGVSSAFAGKERANLPVGDYTFFFGVDTDMNGIPDMDLMVLDSIDVTVQ